MSHDNWQKLQEFRESVYQNLGRARDATFELMDAVMLSRKVDSLADLSLCPSFRRKWSSAYEALEDTRPKANKLMRLYVRQIPTESVVVMAGDHTPWPRPEAKSLKERTYQHRGGDPWSRRPVTVGQGYSTLVWVPESEGSWALPLRHERITSWETPLTKAAWQLGQVCKDLPVRPLTLWDSEYGCASFVLKTAHIQVDKLMRLRSNRCVWGAPPAYGGRGRPRVHGEKFKLNDPTTWAVPAQVVEMDDPKLGQVRVQMWHQLHFRSSPKHPMTLFRVERLEHPKRQPLWLAWVGLPTARPSIDVWRYYLRRFCVDHWYRFAKQRLHWTMPKLKTPQQAERWSCLMPAITWQLWLARDGIGDRPLPWQKPVGRLTPGRTAQAIGSVLARLGTPTCLPKPRGKSPGWPKGRPRHSFPTYPLVKKGFGRFRKPSGST